MSKQTKDRPRLGRGLAALIPMTDTPAADQKKPVSAGRMAGTEAESPVRPVAYVAPVAPPEPPKIAGGKALELKIDAVAANPNQPRQSFSENALRELAESMKANGVIQPILVRQLGADKYQLIAGERRWRAAKLAGLNTMPAIVREVEALTQAQLALIENIQREDLNPIERAQGYQTLMTQMGLTQAELAGRLGEDRSTIANFVRLLELTGSVKEMVRNGKISTGHAKLLAGITDILEQQKMADLVVAQGLSVRNLERVLQERAAGPTTPKAKVGQSAHLADVEKTLCRELGLRVQLRASKERGKGRLVLHYNNLDQFDEIMDRLGVNLVNEG